jgi:hypothetical protein
MIWNQANRVPERREWGDLPPYVGENERPIYGEVGEAEVSRPTEAHLAESHRYREV